MQTKSLDNNVRKALQELAKQDLKNGIKSRFKQDSARVSKFNHNVAGLYIDFSKTHISEEMMEHYLKLAQSCDLIKKRHALFSGEPINITENRSVLHPLLRDPQNQGIETVEPELLNVANDAQQQLLKQCEEIQKLLSTRSKLVTDIIHIGIGGSFLGTQLLFEAGVDTKNKINIHFIINIDAHKLVRVFDQCEPDTTIVIGVSKTFSTAETLQNIHTVYDWYKENNINDYQQYFYAVTANYQNAIDFGIDSQNIVTFPEWVGGRYSVWSSVSLSAVLVLGIKKFQEFLAGAAFLDKHFYQTDLKDNICFIAASLDHYYANFMQAGSRAIFAYDSRLGSLVDYLQQLETESNGKDRQIDGSNVDQKTSPVIWGGVGTDVQHSVFQMLHQGTSLIPAEFIIIKKPDHDLPEHHIELLANAIAQSAALLEGQDIETVKKIHVEDGLTEEVQNAKVFSGERPSCTLVLEQLSPYLLGILLAFYEHRTFCSGVINNINSFDQMGVELGKRLAKQVKPLLAEKSISTNDESFDNSTLELISKLKA